MAIIPARLTSFVHEADIISPNRRRTSDGNYVNKPGDHNVDARGVCHAQDLSHSMPGYPYWEPHFGEFDAFAHCVSIVNEYRAATPAQRQLHWSWLIPGPPPNDGGYMVWMDYHLGYDVIFHPGSHGLDIVMNGSPKTEHFQHAHFSIGYTAQSENDTTPVFGGHSQPLPEDDVTPQDIEKIAEAVAKKMYANDPNHKGQHIGVLPSWGNLYLPKYLKDYGK